MQDFTIVFSKLSNVAPDGVVGGTPRFIIPETIFKSLSINPFRQNKDVVMVKVGIVDGRVGGSEYVFPLLARCDGGEVSAGGGSSTSVEQWARKSGLGVELSAMFEDCRDGDFDVGFGVGMSQRAVKIHRLLGCCVFEYPRLVMLLKSRAVVEMKINNWLAKPIVKILDGCIWAYSQLVSFLGVVKTAGIKVVNVNADDKAQLSTLAQMTEVDGARFSEIHDARWFKWVLNNSFSKEGPAKAYLMFKKDLPIGFFMVKERFHEQASHRGFKNVRLGSVIEWGCLPGCETKLLWRIVLWVMKHRKKLDAVEFPAYEQFVQKFLRRLGWQHVGDANFCYRIRPGSSFKEPKEMDNPANWRLRAGMGDCALN